ncbi:MAG: hypothetical protein K2J08_09815 [Ruminococcus sp.]|nr:hypothetical protein [Ruminococcus sp.]
MPDSTTTLAVVTVIVLFTITFIISAVLTYKAMRRRKSRQSGEKEKNKRND